MIYARRWIDSRWLACAAIVALSADWQKPASAAEFRGDQTVHVQADEVIEGDLYVFGEKITIEGTIKGDLIAFGSQIVVKGPVEGDLIAAGQSLLVESQLADDARVAGQVIKFAASSQIAGDLVAAGMSLELEQGATVGGDVLYAGYQADLSGDIDGDLKAGMGNCRLAGAIGGDVNIEAGGDAGSPPASTFGPTPLPMPSVAPGLTVASTAKVDGEFHYTAAKEADVEEGATFATPPEFTQQQGPATEPAPTTTQIVLGKLRHYACVALLGLLMIALLPRWSTSLADNIRTRPLASLLGGVIAFVAFFIVLIVLIVAVVIIAILAGMATLGELSAVVIVLGILSTIGLIGGFWLFTTYLGQAIASLAIGRLATGRLGAQQTLLAFAVGLVVFALLCSIPYAGGIIALVGMVLALGGLALWMIAGRPPLAVAGTADIPASKVAQPT